MDTSGSIALLDVQLTCKSDGSLFTSIHRKPMHTGRYLSFHSHHSFSKKVSIALVLCTQEHKKLLTKIVTKY